MTGTEENPAGCLFAVIGFIAIIAGFVYFCNSTKSNTTYAEEQDKAYNQKVYSGTYSATVTGTHEYKKDINNSVYVRNSTTTVIE